MFYFYAFLWSVNTPASYCKTLPSGAHFSIIFVPPISGIFLRSQNGSVAFSPENWKWGLIEGKTKASVEVCTSVLTRALISNKPLPPCAASFSCCSNGCFTRAWRVQAGAAPAAYSLACGGHGALMCQTQPDCQESTPQNETINSKMYSVTSLPS